MILMRTSMTKMLSLITVMGIVIGMGLLAIRGTGH
jgi:hypothetical protein